MSLPPFVNEPILELRRRDARDQLTAGMAALEPKLPIPVPMLIGRDRIDGSDLVSTDPGRPERVVALAGPDADVPVAGHAPNLGDCAGRLRPRLRARRARRAAAAARSS